jgi:hypothetical protein
MSSDRPAHLEALLRREFVSTPLAHWGFFFPVTVAVWRFIQSEWPGAVGELHCGFDTEPYFAGDGAEWFIDSVLADERVLNPIERLAYAASNALPQSAVSRGFIKQEELTALNARDVEQLVEALEFVATNRS